MDLEKVMGSYQFNFREALIAQKFFNLSLEEEGKEVARRENVGAGLEEKFFYKH